MTRAGQLLFKEPYVYGGTFAHMTIADLCPELELTPREAHMFERDDIEMVLSGCVGLRSWQKTSLP